MSTSEDEKRPWWREAIGTKRWWLFNFPLIMAFLLLMLWIWD